MVILDIPERSLVTENVTEDDLEQLLDMFHVPWRECWQPGKGTRNFQKLHKSIKENRIEIVPTRNGNLCLNVHVAVVQMRYNDPKRGLLELYEEKQVHRE